MFIFSFFFLDAIFLVDNNDVSGTEFKYFESNQSQSHSYRTFEKLFKFISSQLTGGLKVVIPEATLLLPKLWNQIKTKKKNKKKAFIQALFYLLYRQRVSTAISIKQFCRTSGFDKFLQKHAAMLQEWFELPALVEDKFEVIAETIKGTVQVLFKKPNPVLIKETEALAQRIGRVIHEQELYNKASTAYVACIAAAASHISSENIYKNQKCKIKLTGMGTSWFNFEKVCSYLCIRKDSLWRVVRGIKQKLFETAIKLPVNCPPTVTSYRDVYIIIEDICDYLEYYKEQDTSEELAAESAVIPIEIKKCTVRSLKNLLFSNAETRISAFGLQPPSSHSSRENITYDINVNKLKLLIQDDLQSNKVNCEIISENCNDIYANAVNLDCFGNFNILGYSIRYEVLEVMRDLLRAGCPLDELYTKDFVSLSKKYLEMMKNDEDLSELSDNELELYFNDSFVKSHSA